MQQKIRVNAGSFLASEFGFTVTDCIGASWIKTINKTECVTTDDKSNDYLFISHFSVCPVLLLLQEDRSTNFRSQVLRRHFMGARRMEEIKRLTFYNLKANKNSRVEHFTNNILL
jgi:hypothetical protein